MPVGRPSSIESCQYYPASPPPSFHPHLSAVPRLVPPPITAAVTVGAPHLDGVTPPRCPLCYPACFPPPFIAAAGVDLVHGHSSHHAKGAEVYRGKLILYGCGDLISDYEGISVRERACSGAPPPPEAACAALMSRLPAAPLSARPLPLACLSSSLAPTRGPVLPCRTQPSRQRSRRRLSGMMWGRCELAAGWGATQAGPGRAGACAGSAGVGGWLAASNRSSKRTPPPSHHHPMPAQVVC